MGHFGPILALSSRLHNWLVDIHEVSCNMERERYVRRRDPRTAEACHDHRATAGWKLGRDLSPTEALVTSMAFQPITIPTTCGSSRANVRACCGTTTAGARRLGQSTNSYLMNSCSLRTYG